MIACFHAPTMVDGDLLDDRKAQTAAAASGTGAGGITAVEALEHALEVGFTETRAMVTDAEDPPGAVGHDPHIDRGVGG